MLENSVWQQYHTDKTIREVLAELYGCDIASISSDEAELYAALKRHLTKKELRLFIMNEASLSASEIMENLKMENDTFEQVKHKTYSKLKGNKISKEMHQAPRQ